MKVTYVTAEKLDIGNYSGTGYYIPKALKDQGIELDYINDLKIIPALREKIKRKIYEKGFGKKYFIDLHPDVVRNYGKQINKLLKPNTDLMIGHSSIPFSLLESKIPFVYWSDAVFANMVDFYPEFSGLSKKTIEYGNRMEQEALDRCRVAVFSSEWAAQSALKFYKVSPEKVKIVTYGANIENEISLNEVKEMLTNKPFTECNLLFIGVHWKRKGGDKALAVVKYLNENGLKANLHIVGIEPETEDELPDYVKVHGFISKSTDEGKKKLLDLIAKSHFLLLPTIADCTPIVYSEFNSFGIPVLTTNVGGTSSIITNNVNGVMFNLQSDPEVYGQKIIELFTDANKYKELCLSSYNEYTSRLNWKIAGKNFNRTIAEII